MKARLFILHTGYVESNSTGCLILWHRDGFDTVEEALSNLGATFLALWKLEHEEEMRRAEYKWNRCPHCGKPTVVDKPPTTEDVAELVERLLGETIDGTGELYETLWQYGWNIGPVDAPREALTEAIIVHEYGAEIIGNMALDQAGDDADDLDRHIKLPEGMKLWTEDEP